MKLEDVLKVVGENVWIQLQCSIGGLDFCTQHSKGYYLDRGKNYLDKVVKMIYVHDGILEIQIESIGEGV